MISPTLSIPELIKHLKNSFNESEFDQVEKILIERHDNLSFELQNIETKFHSIKNELHLLKQSLLSNDNVPLLVRLYQERCQVLDENDKLKNELAVVKKQNGELACQLIEALKCVIDQHDVLRGFCDRNVGCVSRVERLEWRNGSGSSGNEGVMDGSGPHATEMGSDFPKWTTASKRKRIARKSYDDNICKQLISIGKTKLLLKQSKITSAYVRKLREFAGIPPEYKIVIPSPQDRPDCPPPGFLCFFAHQMRGGLRFPIPPLYTDIARLFNISLSQLTPHSFSIMAGFAVVVSYSGGEVEPTASLFHSYFSLGQRHGLFYFIPRGGVRFLKGYWQYPKWWRERYFFVSCPQPSWNFPTVWKDSLPGQGERDAVQSLDPAYETLLDRLNKNPYDLSRLAEPGLLYHFGLSPRRKKLLKPPEEIMVMNLLKNKAVISPKRRNVDGLRVERLEWHKGPDMNDDRLVTTEQHGTRGDIKGSGSPATDMGSDFPKWSSKRKRTIRKSDDSCQQLKRIRKPIVRKRDFNPSTKQPYYSIYPSIITCDDVQELREFAGIPHDYKIIIPSKEDRPNTPPPGFLCFFAHQLRSGLRFPIPPLYSDIARIFNISLSQLTPNSFYLMAGFAMVIRYSGDKVEPTASLFRSYFRLSRRIEGFYYFVCFKDVQFLKGIPISEKEWKKHYFFISSPQPCWKFPTHWRVSSPGLGGNVVQCRDPACKNLLEQLNRSPYNLSLLVKPDLLYHFGLSPLCKRLLEPLEDIMEKNLMKKKARPSRIKENSKQTSFSRVKEELD